MSAMGQEETHALQHKLKQKDRREAVSPKSDQVLLFTGLMMIFSEPLWRRACANYLTL
jgi:hypothetical protein